MKILIISLLLIATVFGDGIVTPQTNGDIDVHVVVGETRADGGNVADTDNNVWYIENFDLDRITEWPITATFSRDTYCFDEGVTSSITVVIDGDCPATVTAEADLFIAFEVNGKYMATFIDFDGATVPFGVTPFCGTELHTYADGVTNLAQGPEEYFRADLAQLTKAECSSDWEACWDYIYPSSNGANNWPITVTITNNDVDGTATFTLSSSNIAATSCEYADSFDTGYDIKMYLSADDGNTEDFYFYSFDVTSENTGTLACPDDTISTFNWDTLTEEGTAIPEYTDFSLSVDESDLSLDISVTLTYEGSAFADNQEDNNFGVTYVIDFEDFDAHETMIYEPGTCSNRQHDDFYVNGLQRDFSDWWGYSNNPIADVGTTAYMAYPPPSSFWTIESNGCDTVTYTGSFTWEELIDCTDYHNTRGSYVTIESGDNWLNLTGTLYINVVSPYWYDSDLEYYRVYQILSQPFVIAVSTSIYVLDHTGINLFTMSVVAVYKENAESAYRLIVLTESAEYLRLTRTDDGDLYSYSASGASTYDKDAFEAFDDAVTGETCLGNKDYICSQLWEIKVTDVECNEATNEGTDFSGTYSMRFEPTCRDGHDDAAYCASWLLEHDSIASEVILMTDLVWRDEICDPEVFKVQFSAEYNFYSDAFVTQVDDYDTTLGEEEYLFEVGVSTIYAEIVTEFPSDTIDIFSTELQNVWICTFEPSAVVEDISENAEEGGCFSATVDADSEFTSHIYENGVVALYEFNDAYTTDSADTVRFSFTVPYTVTRDTLYIHAHVEVSLTNGDRRRLLYRANADVTNRMEHFGDIAMISHGQDDDKPTNDKPVVPDSPINYVSPVSTATSVLSLSSPWVITFIALVSLILLFNIAYMCYSNCYSKTRKSGYSSVKVADSEAQSEADQLNPQ